jgi:hypothetical protein
MGVHWFQPKLIGLFFCSTEQQRSFKFRFLICMWITGWEDLRRIMAGGGGGEYLILGRGLLDLFLSPLETTKT